MAGKVTDEKSFGSKIKQLRLARQISLETLANKTGYAQRYLREIEEGRVIPPVSAVI
jgi:transcriptional regulator with XRE-family HTH domain